MPDPDSSKTGAKICPVVKQRPKLTPLIASKSSSIFKTPALVTGLDNIAVMGNAIEHGRGHFGIAEHL